MPNCTECKAYIKGDKYTTCYQCNQKKYTKTCEAKYMCKGDKIPDSRDECFKCSLYQSGKQKESEGVAVKECGVDGCVILIETNWNSCYACKGKVEKREAKAAEQRENAKRKFEGSNEDAKRARTDDITQELIDVARTQADILERLKRVEDRLEDFVLCANHVEQVTK